LLLASPLPKNKCLFSVRLYLKKGDVQIKVLFQLVEGVLSYLEKEYRAGSKSLGNQSINVRNPSFEAFFPINFMPNRFSVRLIVQQARREGEGKSLEERLVEEAVRVTEYSIERKIGSA